MASKIKNFYSKNRLWIILILITLLLFFITLLPLIIWMPLKTWFSNPEAIRQTILSYGKWSVIVYFILSILVIISPAFPNEIVTIVGGYVFNFWTALLFGVAARLIGSTINYWLGTKINKGFYSKILSDNEKSRLNKLTSKIGWQTAFLARFLPTVDTDLIAYMAGMSKMNYWTFIIASFFGMWVPTSFTILIGRSLLQSKALFAILAIFYVVGMLFAPKLIKKINKKNLPANN